MRPGECAEVPRMVGGMVEPKSEVFDEAVGRLTETLRTSRSIVGRIESILLRPMPVHEEGNYKREQPGTVSDALRLLSNDFEEVNEQLGRYADILQKHFGELKLE